MNAISRIASAFSVALLLALPVAASAHGGGHEKHWKRWEHEHRFEHRQPHWRHDFRHEHRQVTVIRERIVEAPVIYHPYRPSVVIHVPPVVIPF